MRLRQRFVRDAVAALAIGIALPVPVTAQSQPASGDALVVSSIGDASRLLPLLATDSASGDIVGLLFNGLLKYNERLEIGRASCRERV